jgi:hypothetical protein
MMEENNYVASDNNSESAPVATLGSSVGNSVGQKTQLEVGDIIYASSRWGGLNKYTIERVTEKQAVYNEGRTRCRRELKASRMREGLYVEKIGDYGHVELENDKIKAQYEFEQSRLRVRNILDKLYKLRVDVLSKAELDSLQEKLQPILNETKQ